MSFNRLNYDDCTYKHNLKQSVGPCDYMVNKPTVECQACLSLDPQVRNQEVGASIGTTRADQVDIHSELLGITRSATNCPSLKYLPNNENNTFPITHLPACTGLPNENTRLSNPPCTLRSTGWNRWEWLCQNPQDKALIPFEYNISYRTVVKDNHRPCIPTPLSQVPILPQQHFNDEVYSEVPACEKPFDATPSVHWRNCKTYEAYNVSAKA